MDEYTDVGVFAARRASFESATRVQAELVAVWKAMLKSADDRKEIAQIFGVKEEVLLQMEAPPIRVTPYQANVGGAEIGLLIGTWFVTEVVLGAFKDLAKEEVKRRLKAFWEYASDRIDANMGSEATGKPVSLPLASISPPAVQPPREGGDSAS